MSTLRHTEEFVIRTYEIDNRKRATVSALVKLMHEAAMQHVIRLKLSVWDLEPHAVSWVLLRQDLHIERLPLLGERISVFTQPAGFQRSFTYRDYRVSDEAGTEIANAASTWLLMNTRERKMAPLLPFIQEYESQMPDPAECLPRPKGRIPRLTRVDFQASFRVDWHDLDFNQHLNNTFYLQWMLEVLPNHILQDRHPHSIHIEYRAEALHGDQLIAEAEAVNDQTFLHRLRRKDTDEILAAAESVWV